MAEKDLANDIVYYGPYACPVCGVMIIKASHDSGGAEYEPPHLVMRVFHRGSECGNPDLCYPMTWTPHVHDRERGAMPPTYSAR